MKIRLLLPDFSLDFRIDEQISNSRSQLNTSHLPFVTRSSESASFNYDNHKCQTVIAPG